MLRYLKHVGDGVYTCKLFETKTQNMARQNNIAQRQHHMWLGYCETNVTGITDGLITSAFV